MACRRTIDIGHVSPNSSCSYLHQQDHDIIYVLDWNEQQPHMANGNSIHTHADTNKILKALEALVLLYHVYMVIL
jgi:hypothetical protein